ncbi:MULTISPECIES: recombinase family protein [unclassified Rathayibacter]|uniref:recombinase family protein n=1 Tax=unclassified Rathayibacter TaxID=2609250 RepID=UPI00188DBF76|nr:MULTISPECIES: recombinase family protein [unclassified Rathayibacter]MBF4461149.1 recombinase family protein [Rathayibacter sp. VKM Ac-2879]MBF4502560.1 recombinase family protein [Rathayibacter sp. VKM Ac-2878]
MLIGYTCVSRFDDPALPAQQRMALLDAGVPNDRLHSDLVVNRAQQRPGLAACVSAIRTGDVLVVWRLDRLGHDARGIHTTLLGRGATLRVLTGPSVATLTAPPRPSRSRAARRLEESVLAR